MICLYDLTQVDDSHVATLDVRSILKSMRTYPNSIMALSLVFFRVDITTCSLNALEISKTRRMDVDSIGNLKFVKKKLTDVDATKHSPLCRSCAHF